MNNQLDYTEISRQRIVGMLETVRFIFEDGHPALAKKTINALSGCFEPEELAEIYIVNATEIEEDDDPQHQVDLDDWIDWLLN